MGTYVFDAKGAGVFDIEDPHDIPTAAHIIDAVNEKHEAATRVPRTDVPELRRGPMRRYTWQGIDEQTGEALHGGSVEAGNPEDAIIEATRDACMNAGHPMVRVTALAEQGVDAAGAAARNLMKEVLGHA
jgi:hypothetical protein